MSGFSTGKPVFKTENSVLLNLGIFIFYQSSHKLSMRATRTFSGQGSFPQISGLRQTYFKNARKKKPHKEKPWKMFPEILLKLYFEWKFEHNQGLLFQKSGHCFRFSNNSMGAEPPSSPSCTPCKVSENNMTPHIS